MGGSDWVAIRLGDVCAKIGSGATPRGGASVYLDAGDIALIRSQNVYNDGFHRDGLTYITEEHADQLSNVEVQRGDVLLNITGHSVARCCRVHPSILPARVNQHVSIIRPDPNRLDARFLRYFMVSPQMQERMLSWAGAGGTRNALTKGMIESFLVLAPQDIAEQQAIARILGALDDKIELNRRINQTLEAMARVIFKSWFVDFDPVRAKAEGRDPGLPDHIASLFPDGFEQSELGQIPRGWRSGVMGDLCEIALGGAWGDDEPFDDAAEAVCLRGVDLQHLRDSGWADAPRRWFKPRRIEDRRVDERDVLVAASGVGPLGRSLWVSSALESAFELPVIYSNFCKRFRCGSVARAVYLDRCLQLMREDGEIWTYATGTSIPNLDSKALLDGKEIAVPPDPLLDSYLAFVHLVNRRLYCRGSRSLEALRDVLLPKLISGQLRVPDPERIAGRLA
ncbi:MAG TPA: restriction endonuclease subunit S [Anaerolineae bacterium]|nr:restriction endonuclease subunit S [Anaerolineae bacterium]